jgi:dihydrofolate synthase / folylpolyglutamate synthase
MQTQALQTPLVQPSADLWPILKTALREQVGQLPERSVIAITSKIISYAQNRLVPKTPEDLANEDVCRAHKHALARQEAERYLEPSASQYQLMFTIKNDTLTVNSGIDESNSGENFILWPEQLPDFLADLWQKIRTDFQVKELGLIVTDSKTYPLRWGVIATCLAHCGFEALHDYRGQKDLFGRTLKMEQANVAEALAVAAALVMGEAAEQTPLCLVTDIQPIAFQDRPPTQEELAALVIAPEDDFFGPMLNAVEWKKGGV